MRKGSDGRPKAADGPVERIDRSLPDQALTIRFVDQGLLPSRRLFQHLFSTRPNASPTRAVGGGPGVPDLQCAFPKRGLVLGSVRRLVGHRWPKDDASGHHAENKWRAEIGRQAAIGLHGHANGMRSPWIQAFSMKYVHENRPFWPRSDAVKHHYARSTPIFLVPECRPGRADRMIAWQCNRLSLIREPRRRSIPRRLKPENTIDFRPQPDPMDRTNGVTSLRDAA